MDTLYVVNAIQDTLRIILSSADKQSEWVQNSPLLIAFGVVIIASIAQIVVARIYKKQYEKNREIELQKISESREIEHKKIRSDLILKDKQKWINEFRAISYDLISLVKTLVYQDSKIVLVDKKVIMKFWNYETRYYLYLDSDNDLHTDFLVHVHSICEINSLEKTRGFLLDYATQVAIKCKNIIKEFKEEISDI